MSRENVGSAVYTAEIDTSKLSGDLSKASAQIKSTGTEAEKAFSAQGSAAATKYGGVVGFVHGQFSALQKQLSAPELGHGIMQGFGIGGGLAAFSLVQEGVGAVVDEIDAFAKAAEAAQAEDAKLNTSLRDNVPNWQATTGAIDDTVIAGNKWGFTSNDIKDSLAQLVTHTHDVTEAVKLQAAAEDLARLKGMDLDTATKILGKVYDGNTSILTRYGIAVAKGSTATEALTAIQKAAGGQAEAFSHTLEGQQAALNAEAETVRERIGKAAMPIMQDFMSFLAGPGMDALNGLLSGLGNIGDAFNNLTRFLNPAAAAEQDYEKAVWATGKAAGLTDEAIQHLIATHQAEIAGVAALNTLHLTGIGIVDDNTTAIFKYIGFTDLQIQSANKAKAAADAQAAANSATGNSLIDMFKPTTDLLGVTGELTAASQLWSQQQAANAAASANQAQADVNAAVAMQHVLDIRDQINAAVTTENDLLANEATNKSIMAVEQLAKQAQDAFDQQKEWYTAGAKALQQLGDGMQSEAKSMLPTLHDLRDFLKNGLKPQDLAMQAIGDKYVAEVYTGMHSSVIGAKEKFQGVAIDAIAAIQNGGLKGAQGQKGLKDIGAYFDDLLASGMTAPEIIARLQGSAGAGGVTDAVKQILFDKTGYKAGGAAVIGAWTEGAGTAMAEAQATIAKVLAKIRAQMVGQSPAKEGPLRELTGAAGAAVFHDWIRDAVGAVANGAAQIRGHLTGIAGGFTAPSAVFAGAGAGSFAPAGGAVSSHHVVRHEIAITPEAAQSLRSAGFDESRVASFFENVLQAAALLPLDMSGLPGR